MNLDLKKELVAVDQLSELFDTVGPTVFFKALKSTFVDGEIFDEAGFAMTVGQTATFEQTLDKLACLRFWVKGSPECFRADSKIAG